MTDEDKDREAEETMNALLAAQGMKIFGNYMEMSALVSTEGKLVGELIDKLAHDLVESVTTVGQRPLHDTQKVIISQNPWMGNTKTVAAKLYTTMTARPAQFLAFCGFKMEEAKSKAAAAEARAREYRGRYDRLRDAAMAADDISKVRTLIEEWEREF